MELKEPVKTINYHQKYFQRYLPVIKQKYSVLKHETSCLFNEKYWSTRHLVDVKYRSTRALVHENMQATRGLVDEIIKGLTGGLVTSIICYKALYCSIKDLNLGPVFMYSIIRSNPINNPFESSLLIELYRTVSQRLCSMLLI